MDSDSAFAGTFGCCGADLLTIEPDADLAALDPDRESVPALAVGEVRAEIGQDQPLAGQADAAGGGRRVL
ncbi:MAG: hypothetical protein A2Y77_04260 [Planctomycetes bacterium RBG_13_62_9]|nr:MAG: hypothetical protein A2Y77_04260 [Planctomycetes bacterium RBG_13_62_9]